jgi:hypothetical protein
MLLLAALIIAGAMIWSALRIAREIESARSAAARGRSLQLLELFTAGIAAAEADPRALLVWQPMARAARDLFPEETAAIDRAAGSTFPFSRERLQAAHAAWTADWLAWEGTHDAEYKLKAVAAEHDAATAAGSPLGRARVDAIEREKLEKYQRRYEEYIRVAKALQALIDGLATPKLGPSEGGHAIR